LAALEPSQLQPDSVSVGGSLLVVATWSSPMAMLTSPSLSSLQASCSVFPPSAPSTPATVAVGATSPASPDAPLPPPPQAARTAAQQSSNRAGRSRIGLSHLGGRGKCTACRAITPAARRRLLHPPRKAQKRIWIGPL
jgi:hypothetical protein